MQSLAAAPCKFPHLDHRGGMSFLHLAEKAPNPSARRRRGNEGLIALRRERKLRRSPRHTLYDSRLVLGIGEIRHLFESEDPFAWQCFPIPRKFHQIPNSVYSDGVHLRLHCKSPTCSIRSLDSFSVCRRFTGVRKEQAGREPLRSL
jgi:hypothetical protein